MNHNMEIINVIENLQMQIHLFSFADAGNDFNSSEDVAEALKYISRLRNSDFAVANIETESKITGTTSPLVNSFH